MKRTRVAQMDKASWTRVAQHLGGPGLPLVCHASGNPPRLKTWSLSRSKSRSNYFNEFSCMSHPWCPEWPKLFQMIHEVHHGIRLQGNNLFSINTDRLYRYFVFTYHVHKAMRDYQLVASFCRCKISRTSKPNLWTLAGMIVWNGRWKSVLIK